ncbi:phosphoinositide 3-kinase regulatory subunit 4-like [Watersipora subatra]|uniref:phosphoinositide 3-kinase regulatory subunit 4-like n=1 Tax=Watersipora subatra TaxID=2589382 RepID=UPI00355B5891
MGNQITAKTPYEILPVERYLPSLPRVTFEASLGSTRFLKVAKVSTEEGKALVVKVFVIQDPSLSLKEYAAQVNHITDKLSGATNCLPFQYSVVSEKAGFLVRQYTKYNLYDRISTRPFLTTIEKKWIAFQLLSALSQCHKHNICHGDIKSENICITSWNWVLLTDFAVFKPTYLPENNPSDYNYFFDTSRRRTCYIAPERFKSDGVGSDQCDIFTTRPKEELTHAMDVFSLACVLIELFSDGKVPFNLSQLLSYRNGEYSTWKILETISDRHIKEMLRSMMKNEPGHRLTSEEYLIQQQGKAFPAYFYTYLKVYVQNYRLTTYSPDERINKVRKDLANVMKNTGVTRGQDGDYEPLVIILEIITSSIRELKFCETKLTALKLLLEFTDYLPSDLVLDRIIPHMMNLLEDPISRVKAEAIRTVTLALANVNYVPKNEANIFPDYILPAMNNLTTHNSVEVRVALAENIAALASTAVKYLNSPQTDNQVSFEVEMQTLHDLVQAKAVSLLSDSDNSVKRAMLRHSVAGLAVIFGKQKASDVILSHMITYLNDKKDWQLRAEFFLCVDSIMSYIGWQSTLVLKPLIEQSLTDTEEFVITKCLHALRALFTMPLMEKSVICKFLVSITPLLSHPNQWIRYGVAQCVSKLATLWCTADIHCHLIPLVKPFFAQPAIQIHRLDVLIHSLHEPLPRLAYDYLIKSNHLSSFFSYLQDRQLQRNVTKPSNQPNYFQPDEQVLQMWKRLSSLGITDSMEDRILKMKDFMLKINAQMKSGTVSSEGPNSTRQGRIDIATLSNVQRRHADLRPKVDESRVAPIKQSSLDIPVGSTDVRAEFRNMDIMDSAQRRPPHIHSVAVESKAPVSDSTYSVQSSPRPIPAQQFKQARCRLDLRTLVHQKRDEYEEDIVNKEQMMASAVNNCFPIPFDWKPQGILISQIHEHKDSITRILVHQNQEIFLTSSKDGSIRVWQTYKADHRLCNVSRSSAKYIPKQGGSITDMIFCTSNHWLACLNNSDSIHLINMETADSFSLKETQTVDTHTYGRVAALCPTDYGPRDVICYGTVNGNILGWDLRSGKIAYKLKHPLQKGLITCMTSHSQEKWLTVGTANGHITLFDMRFHLSVNSLEHPAGQRVNRLSTHPSESSWVIASMLGNNEVSMWNLETNQREKTLWASSAPLFSTEKYSKHWVNGLHIHHSDAKSFIITGGTDMRLRYWDMSSPADSSILVHAAADPQYTIAKYSPQVMDGTACTVETYHELGPYEPTSLKMSRPDIDRQRQDKIHPGHRDIITDVAMYHTMQCFIVSTCASGVVKVWK